MPPGAIAAGMSLSGFIKAYRRAKEAEHVEA